MKLTNQTIAKLSVPHGQSEIIFFDDDVAGFGIRIRDGGSRTWVFQYKLGSKQRRISFGSVGAMPAPKARVRAEQLHAQVKLGQDPAGQKIEATAKAAETFEPIVKRYLAFQQPQMKPRSYEEIERHLLTHAKPLHALPLTTIDQRTVAARLGEIAANSGAVASNRVRATLSALFNWTIGEGLLQSNPAAFTNKREEKSRDRVLSADELRIIWNALPAGDFGDIVRLLMLTGQRRDEIGAMGWSEIDFDRKVIKLESKRTKNGREHEVPMSAAVCAILEARPSMAGRDHVFGLGEGGFGGWSKCRERLDETIAAEQKQSGRKAKPSIAPWVLHDIRRSVATHMAEDLGIQPHIIEAILNHVSGHKNGVAGIYNRAGYEREKRMALDLWAEHLTAIVEKRESNVTPLKRA